MCSFYSALAFVSSAVCSLCLPAHTRDKQVAQSKREKCTVSQVSQTSKVSKVSRVSKVSKASGSSTGGELEKAPVELPLGQRLARQRQTLERPKFGLQIQACWMGTKTKSRRREARD